MTQVPKIRPEVIERWRQELTEIPGPETVKIVSGELNCDLHSGIKDTILWAIENRGASFKFIGGPVFSVDENGENATLELARNGIVDLWVSPARQLSHFRVYGRRFAFEEDYHEALEEERSGYYLHNPLSVYKLSREFDALIDVLEMQKVNGKQDILLATKEMVVKVKEQCGENYDFLTEQEFKGKLALIA